VDDGRNLKAIKEASAGADASRNRGPGSAGERGRAAGEHRGGGLSLRLKVAGPYQPIFDRRLRWAETFVATRSKLLELITVEVWLQEMLAIIEEEVPGAKARILERIRARIIGREIPAPLGITDELSET
jgi:hypothetical protein